MIRLTANGVPGFQCDGISVGSSWVGQDLGALPPKARDALVKYSGRFIRVHPEDVGRLADHGLELYLDAAGAERLRELELKPRELAEGEQLAEGTIPPGVTSTPIAAPASEPSPPPAPSGRAGRRS